MVKFKFKVWQRVTVPPECDKEYLVLQRPDHYFHVRNKYNSLLKKDILEERKQEFLHNPSNLVYQLGDKDGGTVYALEHEIVPCGDITKAIFGW